MVGLCEALESWDDDMDREERFDFLRELIQNALEDWGYESVTVVMGDVDDPDADGSYDPDTDTITLDGNSLEGDDFSAWDGIATAMHEALHAMDDQDFEGNYDYFGDQGQSPTHGQLDGASKGWASERQEECEQEGESLESPWAEPLPPISLDLS